MGQDERRAIKVHVHEKNIKQCIKIFQEKRGILSLYFVVVPVVAKTLPQMKFSLGLKILTR